MGDHAGIGDRDRCETTTQSLPARNFRIIEEGLEEDLLAERTFPESSFEN